MTDELTIKLSAEQLEAISRDGNLIVRAGAGSGKTEVLARRFVALLAGDLGDHRALDPARLAALTFTEKAALDMRERIASVLADRIAITTESELHRHLHRAERTLGLARISTIHAFCARILRENAIAAGLDPDFEVLDDYESIIFYERICREVLVKEVRAGHPGALTLVQARRLENDSPREDAREIIRRILTEARRRGEGPEQIVARTEKRTNRLEDESDHVAPLAEQLAGLIDTLVGRSDIGGVAGDRLRDLGELWKSVRTRVCALDRSASAGDIEVLRGIVDKVPNAVPKIKDLILTTRELLAKANTKYGLAGELISAWGEYRALEVVRPVAELIATAGEAIAEAERARRVMTFDGLLIGVRDLFQSNPQVVSRYRRELRALLVDEYQDTNNVQDEIIRLLTDPAGLDDEEAPQLFIVGDEKQSIYRFRGADVSVFNRPRAAAAIALNENRRSTPNILDFANGVAAIAMKAPGEPRSYRTVWSEQQVLRPTRQVVSDYPVEVIAQIEDDAQDEAKLAFSSKRIREGMVLADRIRQIVDNGEPLIDPESGLPRPAQFRDCVILMRAFGDIAIYEDALAAAGIPTYTVKGRGFYGRPEVIDLISLLHAIADPRDALAVATVLRSPFFTLSDDCLMQMGLYLYRNQGRDGISSIADLIDHGDLSALPIERFEAQAAAAVLRELRAMRDREPLHRVVERSLELTDYESVMAGLPQGEQRIANLRKIMEIARRFDTLRFFTFRDFVSYLNRLVSEEPYEPQAQIPGENDDVVRLMTVHQAKGLEFPIVVIADAGRKPPSNNTHPLLDPVNGLLMCATAGSGYDEIPNAALKRYRDRLEDEEEAESARILYVALTRARDRLIVSEGANRAGWSKHLCAFLDEHRDDARFILRSPDLKMDRENAPSRTESELDEGASAPRIRKSIDASQASTGARVISPTALADFARCPRRYWLRHGLGLPEPSSGAATGEADAIAMGSVAHAVLERLHYGLEHQPEGARIRELAHISGRRSGLTQEQCAELAQDLTRYVATISRAEQVLAREVPFMLNPAPRLFIRGQIDVLLKTVDTIVVRDYKYATKSDVSRYQIQLECYVLAVAEHFPTSRIETQIVTLRDEASVITLPTPSASAIKAKIAELGDQLGQAARNSDYGMTPANAAVCKALRCGYRARCWNGG